MVETLAVAVCGTLAGADNFQEIELCAENRVEWVREFLPLKNDVPL
ncbi:transposase family protein [Salmonella enterica]|nr:transposase family protein [Salmonella enterica]EMB7449135.1 transposase family protein [Salmonella enterica]